MRWRISHKPIQALAFLVTAVVFINTARGQSLACFDLFQLPTLPSASLKSLFQEDARTYLDSYGRAQHERNFWSYHERYGVYRQSNGRIVLQAKTQEMGEQLLADLITYTGSSRSQVTTIHKPGWFNKTVSYDITAILPQVLRERLEVDGVNPGPNCINNCLLMSHYASSAIYHSGKEIKHLLNSAFARPIADANKLRPGDLLIFYTVNPLGGSLFFHAAIYISPRLALSKNGFDAAKPTRIMDMQEVLRMSLNMTREELLEAGGPGSHRIMRAYRLLDIEEVLTKAGIKIPDNYLIAKEDFGVFEQKLALYFDHGRKKEVTQLKDELYELEHRWRGPIHKNEQDIQNSNLRADQKDLLLTLWEILENRLVSYRQILTSQ